MADPIPNIDELVDKLRHFGDVILLESQKKDHPASKKSYVAGLAKLSLFGFEDHSYSVDKNVVTQLVGNPWELLADFQNKHKDWLFGYFGYEMKNFLEALSSKNEYLNNLPLYYFMIPGLIVEYDFDGKARIIKGNLNMQDIEPESRDDQSRDLIISSETSLSKEEYLEKVDQAKNLIHEGEVYEINYSYARKFKFQGNGWGLYKKMRETGPVPFGAFLQLNHIEVCCASPERFLSKEGNRVYSQPIKGTISNSDQSDLASLKSEKNLAENLMIVDLVRNDLNRVAQFGSVQVNNLFEIQSFDTVHQLVSTIEGIVDENTQPLEIIKACFPMGSMTGAPKIAAMKAIEDLENYARGIYSGAIGYFTPEGDFDFNVVIRTAIIQDEELVYPVGGAITADSIPSDEWEETLIKTLALKKAVKLLSNDE